MTTRIYQAGELTSHSTVTLDLPASHHLSRVLRKTVGESVILFNGRGGEYSGTIKEINKHVVKVDLVEFIPRDSESALNISLWQGISRGEKMDYTIQKAVELGVKHIVPLFTERATVKLDLERSEKRLRHWQSIVISACEQSGRNRIPSISKAESLEKWLPTVKADFCFVLSPTAERSLKQWAIPATAHVVLLIGPEGGLSPREIDLAIQHHFLPLNLGPRILRTETAAVAAMTALQSCYGDMG